MDRFVEHVDWEALPSDVAEWMGMPDLKADTCPACGTRARSTGQERRHRCDPVVDQGLGGVAVAL